MLFFNKKNKEINDYDSYDNDNYEYYESTSYCDDCEKNDDCKCDDCDHDCKPKPPCCVTGPTGATGATGPAGDILTVRNHSSASAVTLQTLAGGTQINSNASILIQRLS